MAATASVPSETKRADWDEFVNGLLTDPAKVEAFRKECDDEALKTAPHMTKAQLDASWDYMREVMGF